MQYIHAPVYRQWRTAARTRTPTNGQMAAPVDSTRTEEARTISSFILITGCFCFIWLNTYKLHEIFESECF